MGKIIWCIENTDDNDKNPITNHGDSILGCLASDDRFGDYIGTENDYNTIVRDLFKRVSTYTNESYLATFSDDTILIVQINIANNAKASIFSIAKQ